MRFPGPGHSDSHFAWMSRWSARRRAVHVGAHRRSKLMVVVEPSAPRIRTCRGRPVRATDMPLVSVAGEAYDHRLMQKLPLVLFALCLLASPAAAQTARTGELGTIQCPTSAKVAAAQAAFLTGVKGLHNFEFDTAADAFRDAQKAEPGFALAYWGEAMS